MGWTLAPDTYYCTVNGRSVLLNVARDRYLLLPERLQTSFDAWTSGADNGFPDVLTPLAEAGMAVEDNGPTKPASAFAVPRARTGTEQASDDGFQLPWAGWCWVRPAHRARRSLARRGLKATLDQVRADKARISRGGDPAKLAAGWMAARGYRSIAGDCLVQSLALMDMLHRHYSTALLVFGVTLEPFRAHCWVQHDTVILNDAADVIVPFTPILVL